MEGQGRAGKRAAEAFDGMKNEHDKLDDATGATNLVPVPSKMHMSQSMAMEELMRGILSDINTRRAMDAEKLQEEKNTICAMVDAYFKIANQLQVKRYESIKLWLTQHMDEMMQIIKDCKNIEQGMHILQEKLCEVPQITFGKHMPSVNFTNLAASSMMVGNNNGNSSLAIPGISTSAPQTNLTGDSHPTSSLPLDLLE